MPTLTSQPVANQRIAGYGECANFCFDVSDAIISGGAVSQIAITVTPDNQTSGEQFTVAGVVFTVNGAIANNTATEVNLTAGTAQEKAERLRSLFLSNANFGNDVEIGFIASGVNVLLNMYWKRAGANPVSPTDFSGLSFHYAFNAAIGADAQLVEGYRVGFEVFVDQVSQGVEAIEPSYDPYGQPVGFCIDMLHIVRPHLQSEFPILSQSVPERDLMFIRNVVVKYGVMKKAGCGYAQEPFLASNAFQVWPAAIQEEDRGRLYRWTNKFLTKRPSYCICPNQSDFLWINLTRIADTQDPTGVYSARYFWQGGNQTVLFAQQADGIWRIPSGIPNTPVPDTAVAYTVQVVFTTDGGEQVVAEAVYSVDRSACMDTRMWFLGDLGSYEPICLKFTEQSVEVEQSVVCAPIECVPTDVGYNYTKKLMFGGKSVVKTNAMRRFSAQTEYFADSAYVSAYLESFIKSPIKYVQFDVDGLSNPRNIFIDPASFAVRTADGLTALSFEFFMHKELSVQRV